MYNESSVSYALHTFNNTEEKTRYNHNKCETAFGKTHIVLPDSSPLWFESISPCHSRLLTNRPQLVYNFPVTDIHLNLALAGTLSRLFTTSLPAIPTCTQNRLFGYTFPRYVHKNAFPGTHSGAFAV